MLKEQVCNFIDGNKDLLIEVSKEIFNNPELGFKEYKASKLLTSKLESANFEVELGAADLETAIYAVHPNQTEGPTVAILGEYDALRGRIFQGLGYPGGEERSDTNIGQSIRYRRTVRDRQHRSDGGERGYAHTARDLRSHPHHAHSQGRGDHHHKSRIDHL